MGSTHRPLPRTGALQSNYAMVATCGLKLGQGGTSARHMLRAILKSSEPWAKLANLRPHKKAASQDEELSESLRPKGKERFLHAGCEAKAAAFPKEQHPSTTQTADTGRIASAVTRLRSTNGFRNAERSTPPPPEANAHTIWATSIRNAVTPGAHRCASHGCVASPTQRRPRTMGGCGAVPELPTSSSPFSRRLPLAP